jgi:hypothetical protein
MVVGSATPWLSTNEPPLKTLVLMAVPPEERW